MHFISPHRKIAKATFHEIAIWSIQLSKIFPPLEYLLQFKILTFNIFHAYGLCKTSFSLPLEMMAINNICQIVSQVNKDQKQTAYQSCKRTVRSSRYIVFDRKSIPIVACKCRVGCNNKADMQITWVYGCYIRYLLVHPKTNCMVNHIKETNMRFFNYRHRSFFIILFLAKRYLKDMLINIDKLQKIVLLHASIYSQNFQNKTLTNRKEKWCSDILLWVWLPNAFLHAHREQKSMWEQRRKRKWCPRHKALKHITDRWKRKMYDCSFCLVVHQRLSEA